MLPIFSSWMFAFMSVHFLLLLLLLGLNFKYLWQKLKSIKLRVWIILILIFLCGFYLRNAEYWRGPFSDGYVYEHSAEMWILHGDYNSTCQLGNQSDCHLSSQALFLPGYPYLIALIHLIFGINTLNASVISAVLSSLTIIIIFLISYLIFKKEQAGLFAALIFALIPLNIIQSQTGLSRPVGLFFVGLTILFYLLALKNNRFLTWLLAAGCLSFAIYVRQESYVLLPLLLLFIVISKYGDIRLIFRKIFAAGNNKIQALRRINEPVQVLILFFLLQLPALNWFIWHNPYSTLPGDGIWGLYYKGLLIQGQALFLQLFNQSPLWPQGIFHYNWLISIIFIFSFTVLLFSRRKMGYFILSVYLVYFLVYSLMFDGHLLGNDQLTHDYVRRSLMMHLPYAIIAGYGLCILNPFRWRNKTVLIVVLGLVYSLFAGYLFVRAINMDTFSRYYNFYFPHSIFRDSRTDNRGRFGLAHSYRNYWAAINKIPDNCLIITYYNLIVLDNHFADKNLRAAQIGMIQANTADLFTMELEKQDCIIYFEDWYCRKPTYIPWQAYNYPCWYVKNKLDTKFLFQEGHINVYRASLRD